MAHASFKITLPITLAAALAAACGPTVLTPLPGGAGGGPSTGSATTTSGAGGVAASSSSSSTSASSGASSSSGSMASSSGSASSSGGGTWQAGEPGDINLGGVQLDALVAVQGGAIAGLRSYEGNVAWWNAQRLDEEGVPFWPLQKIMQGTTSGSVGSMSLAAGNGHIGAVAWDGQDGCGFVPLQNDGGADGPRVDTGSTWCQGLAADAVGFSFLGGLGLDPPDLVHLSATGVPSAPEPMSSVGAFRGRVDRADGSILLVWSTDGIECVDCPLHVVAQLFSFDGVAIDGPHQVFTDATFGFPSDQARVAILAAGDRNLLAWSPENLGDPLSGAVTVIPLDATGAAAGAHVLAALPDGKGIGGLGLAAAPNGEVLVAWTAPAGGTGGGDTTLRARALSPEGASLGPAFDVAGIPGGSRVRMVGTSAGVLVLVQAGSTVTAVPLVVQ